MSEETREPDQLAGIRLPEHAPAVVGHQAARATITERLAKGRMPGGILLHGPREIGKATLAFAAARQIFAATADETPERVTAQVMAGAYPNLFILRRQPRDTGRGFYTQIRIDDVRGLRERMQRTRGRTGHRVAIIDAIDDCNDNAANALLKTLEEPPADTTFLLISHRPGALLPTIRSRCHQVALRPLADDDVLTVLAEQRPGTELDRAVSLSGGRPRRGFEALALSEDSALGALERLAEQPRIARAGSPPCTRRCARGQSRQRRFRLRPGPDPELDRNGGHGSRCRAVRSSACLGQSAVGEGRRRVC